MENPSICLTGPDRVTTSEQASASKERRRRLPQLSTKSGQEAAANEADYSQFSLSPMRSPLTARNLMRSALSHFTPITAVAVKGPAIATPGTPLRTTLLERYLSEHRPMETLNEDSPRTSPLTLSKVAILDALQAPSGLPWSINSASTPETNSDCFSPVLGTGPAEQFQGLSPLSFEPPISVIDEDDDDDGVVLITLPWETAATLCPRRNSFPSYGEEVQKSGNFFKTLPEPRSPNGPTSPISERGYASRSKLPTPAFSKDTRTNSTTPPPASTFDALPNEMRDDPNRVGPSPCSSLPPPMEGSFPEIPAPTQSAERSVIDPPPAPMLSRSPVDLPASRNISFPAPINTSIPQELRFFPSPGSAFYSPVPPTPFLDAVLKSPPPAPTPTKVQFAERFPASPRKNKPAPIDTSPFLGHNWEDGPLSTAKPIHPPPAPNALRLQFLEQLPASPVRSRPAPIDTSPRLDQTFDNGDPNTAISYENPPPAPDASKLRFSEQLPPSPARSKPAPIDTSPRLDQSFDSADLNTAISLENPPPAPQPSKVQFSERFPPSPARSKPAPIDTSPRFDQTFGSEDPNTAISLQNPPPAPLPSKVQFSERLPPSPARSKPAPIDTSPRFDQTFGGEDPNTVIPLQNPPPAPLPSKVQFAERLPPSPVRSKPAPIDTSARPDLANSYAELLNSARTPHQPPSAPTVSRFANRPKRVVRFADDVESPAVRSAVPVTPHPWRVKSPRALGGTVDVALVTPTSAELIPKSAVERKGDPWESMPATVVTEEARGRSSRRMQQAGRLTRSVSPPSPGAGLSEEVVAIRVLPNTVYDSERGALVPTIEKISSAHYLLVPAVYQQEKA